METAPEELATSARPAIGGAAGMRSARAPFCPNCGSLAAQWTVYEETAAQVTPISAPRQLTRLLFTCEGCKQRVTVEAAPSFDGAPMAARILG